MNFRAFKLHWLGFAFIFDALLFGIVAGQQVTYEKHVRPILKTHCFQCHGEGGELQGGLDLRLRRLIVKGGESGESIVSGNPAESNLLQRLIANEMPPERIALRPTQAEIDTITAWIASGATAIRSEPENLNPDNYITEEERAYWAFQPVRRPPLPEVTSDEGLNSPIDRFVNAKLQASGLSQSPEADAISLARRVYFDLVGLPPTVADVEALARNASGNAYSELVDLVLNSPRYGERWARHWLDVAGYADSEGYTDEDPIRPEAYKYRDYVIRAFNADKPFDEFIVEQLAGDELLARPLENLTQEQTEKLIATGFLRTAPDGTGASGVDQNVARNDVIAKTIEIVSTSLLGLTVGCAQCHNHRYDPILQEDYYAIRAIFEPSLDWKNWLSPANRRISLYTDSQRKLAAEIDAQAQKILDERTQKQKDYIEATFQRELAKLENSLHEPIKVARNTPEKERTDEQKKLLKEYPSVNVSAGSLYLYDQKAADDLKKMNDEAEAIRANKPTEEFVRAIWEPTGKELPKTYLFHRGDFEQPKQEVAPRELTVLASASPVEIPCNGETLTSSGRRLGYAKWLTSGKHPLVARVIANRIWLQHFGRGLVPTPGDFGALGTKPTHPELLDWLASELVDSGWSVKHLQRLIMNSATYRQSSRRHERGDAVDSENLLYWRMPMRRLEAESLRDAVLAVSGELNTKAFGPAVPVMPDRVGQFVVGIENLNAGRPGEEIPMNGEDLRRSIYIEARRSRPLSVLAPFDLPRMEPNCTLRNVSTVSPQSLLMMNSEFVLARAEQIARRVEREAGEERTERLRLVWQLVFSSSPDEQALADAEAFIQKQLQHFAGNPLPEKKAAPRLSPASEALASFCHALLCSNRFLYID